MSAQPLHPQLSTTKTWTQHGHLLQALWYVTRWSALRVGKQKDPYILPTLSTWLSYEEEWIYKYVFYYHQID
jgi:hypothetical protein